jgi:CheY-like chemotaxis protein
MPIVLIVEDQAEVLILAESILQRAGYETLTAATVAEAQAIINSKQHLDLIFTDLALGNHQEGGITIGHLIEQGRKDLPVLYTSGRELTDGLKELFNSKGSFLSKPYTERALTEAVAKLVPPK